MIDTNIRKTDVIPIVNYCWDRSFAKVKSNQKAIAERGWNPLNYYILDSPELNASTSSNETNTPTPPPTTDSPRPNVIIANDNQSIVSPLSSNITSSIDINFRDGLAGSCVLTLLEQAAKDKECMVNLNKRRDLGKNLSDHLKESKRITAGVIFNAGHVNLSKQEVLDAVRKKYEKRNKELLDKIMKELERFCKRKEKARKCFTKFKKKNASLISPKDIPETDMNAEDLKFFIMVLKRKKDKALPKKIQDLRMRWRDVKHLAELQDEEHLLDNDFQKEHIISTLIRHPNYLHVITDAGPHSPQPITNSSTKSEPNNTIIITNSNTNSEPTNTPSNIKTTDNSNSEPTATNPLYILAIAAV